MYILTIFSHNLNALSVGDPLVYTNPLHFTDEGTEIKLEKLSIFPNITPGVKSRAESKFPTLNSDSPGVSEKI